MKLNQWELACIEYALRDFKDNLKNSARTDLISGSESAFEKLVVFIKECESKCDVGNYTYTAELKFEKKGTSVSSNKSLVYELMVFFKDEEQPTETEYYEKKADAEKRKEFILADKDSWFRSEDVEAIEISDEPQMREFI